MASIDVAKIKSGGLGGMSIHFDQDLRKECKHSNPDINPALSHLNFFINANSYKEGVEKINDFIKKTDEKIPPKRVRSDRVTGAAFEFPIPDAIAQKGDEAIKKFAEIAQKFIAETYHIPPEFVFGVCHRDEIHTYKDQRTHAETLSLNHVHLFAPAYSEEHGINGKFFFSKQNIDYGHLNAEFDNVIKEQFGIAYMTGGIALGQSVEQLKSTQKQIEKIEEKIEEHKRLGGKLVFDKSEVEELKNELISALTINERCNAELKQKTNEYQKYMNDVFDNNIAKEKQRLSEEFERRVQGRTQNLTHEIQIKNKVIQDICQTHNIDYNRLNEAMEQSLYVGHENAWKKALHPDQYRSAYQQRILNRLNNDINQHSFGLDR